MVKFGVGHSSGFISHFDIHFGLLNTTAALRCDDFVPLIGREVLQSPEQVTSEASTLRLRPFHGSTGEQFGKEIMRQFPRGIFLASVPGEKGHHGRIVGFTQVAELRDACVSAPRERETSVQRVS